MHWSFPGVKRLQRVISSYWSADAESAIHIRLAGFCPGAWLPLKVSVPGTYRRDGCPTWVVATHREPEILPPPP